MKGQKVFKVKLVEIATVKFMNKDGSPVEVTAFGKSKREATEWAEKWAEQHDDDFKTWWIQGEPKYVAEVVEEVK